MNNYQKMQNMFENEAKEYSERTKTEAELEVLNTVHYWGQESLSPDERRLFGGIQDRKRAREQGFQDGAMFGYNKANEWHSVYDDLPKENKKYWVLTSDGEPKVDSWLSVSWINFYDIVAWKEIVLPKDYENGGCRNNE